MAASAKRRRGWRKRLGALARFTGALVIVGGLYSVFSPSLYAQESEDNSIDSEAVKGQELYDTSCITCHGDNGEGIEGRGPSLIGVGSAAVEFQVNTGRMPMAAQGAQAPEANYPVFDEEEARWLGAYIEYLGGGAKCPTTSRRSWRTPTSAKAASSTASTAPPATATPAAAGPSPPARTRRP